MRRAACRVRSGGIRGGVHPKPHRTGVSLVVRTPRETTEVRAGVKGWRVLARWRDGAHPAATPTVSVSQSPPAGSGSRQRRRIWSFTYSSYTTNTQIRLHSEEGGSFHWHCSSFRHITAEMDEGKLRRQARLVPPMGRPDGQRWQSCRHGVLAAGLRRCAGGARGRAQPFVWASDKQTRNGTRDAVQPMVCSTID